LSVGVGMGQVRFLGGSMPRLGRRHDFCARLRLATIAVKMEDAFF
jgi:hypothetical protein